MVINKLKLNVVCDTTRNLRNSIASLVNSAGDKGIEKSSIVVLKQLDAIDKRAQKLFNTAEKPVKPVMPIPPPLSHEEQIVLVKEKLETAKLAVMKAETDEEVVQAEKEYDYVLSDLTELQQPET